MIDEFLTETSLRVSAYLEARSMSIARRLLASGVEELDCAASCSTDPGRPDSSVWREAAAGVSAVGALAAGAMAVGDAMVALGLAAGPGGGCEMPDWGEEGM